MSLFNQSKKSEDVENEAESTVEVNEKSFWLKKKAFLVPFAVFFVLLLRGTSYTPGTLESHLIFGASIIIPFFIFAYMFWIRKHRWCSYGFAAFAVLICLVTVIDMPRLLKESMVASEKNIAAYEASKQTPIKVSRREIGKRIVKKWCTELSMTEKQYKLVLDLFDECDIDLARITYANAKHGFTKYFEVENFDDELKFKTKLVVKVQNNEIKDMYVGNSTWFKKGWFFDDERAICLLDKGVINPDGVKFEDFFIGKNKGSNLQSSAEKLLKKIRDKSNTEYSNLKIAKFGDKFSAGANSYVEFNPRYEVRKYDGKFYYLIEWFGSYREKMASGQEETKSLTWTIKVDEDGDLIND